MKYGLVYISTALPTLSSAARRQAPFSQIWLLLHKLVYFSAMENRLYALLQRESEWTLVRAANLLLQVLVSVDDVKR